MRTTAYSVLLFTLLGAAGAGAQAPTPDSLAHLVLARFVSGTPDAFDSLDPDPVGRTVVRTAAERHLTREAGLARVLSATPGRAVLLLTGTVREGKAHGLSAGGDETNQVRRFSGIYEAVRSGTTWALTHQIPFDSANVIREQTLHVALSPGKTARIVDTLAVTVGSPYGFGARLNNAARITALTVDGRQSPYAFAGGVLWVTTSKAPRARLVLTYTIDTPDSAAAHGAMHNTDAWHPFFNYDSGNDLAPLSVTVTLPAAYHLTTTAPQTESVHDGVRTVHGQSQYPQFLLALIYDRNWQPAHRTIDSLRVATFVTPGFKFSIDTMATVIARVHRILAGRFGEPRGMTNYFAVVEDRELHGGGFAVRMNDAIVSGDKATFLDEPDLGPSYPFAHEVSHAWTMNASGPAANFLREGWATYSESLLLRDVFGAAAEEKFWDRASTGYFAGNRFEGKQSILGNPDNGRIHYTKGSWILRALNTLLGDAVFDRGMREYIARCGHGPDGYEELIAAMSHAAGHDMTAFIMPWLSSQYVPDVDARVDGSRLIVTQSQPGALFDLPLDIALQTAAGESRRAVHSDRTRGYARRWECRGRDRGAGRSGSPFPPPQALGGVGEVRADRAASEVRGALDFHDAAGRRHPRRRQMDGHPAADRRAIRLPVAGRRNPAER